MKLPLKWVEEYLKEAQLNWDEVLDKLTLAGIEVEKVTPVATKFEGVVVGEVVECEPHPNADKLSKCLVNVGELIPLQIICGASNVKAGIKVPCALVGATLPNGLVIAKRKMRDLESCGMLCSASEIGLQDNVDGLLILDDQAPVGASVYEYLNLDEKIVEFKITPNRSDALSVLGIAREIQALTSYSMNYELDNTLEAIKTPSSSAFTLEIDESAKFACPKYVALVINNVNAKVVLPKFITDRLTYSNIRSISPIVDLTNYVMLELGQPLHAFDKKKIGLKLKLTHAKPLDKIVLLNEKEVQLNVGTLITLNEANEPVAITGVMGGLNSAIDGETQDIIVESAFFTPESIQGVSRAYGLNSDAAYRFERGVDPLLQQKAAFYASSLIQKYCGGQVTDVVTIDNLEDSYTNNIVTLSYLKLNQVLGIEIDQQMVKSILVKLGFSLIKDDSTSLMIKVPSFRFDIKIEEDVIEEIARVYGYDKIPAVLPYLKSSLVLNQEASLIAQLKLKLTNLGFNEIISYAFLEPQFEQLFGNPNYSAVHIQNPIAGLSMLRTSLIAGLIKTLDKNARFGYKRAKLFEIAKAFYGTGAHEESLKLAALVYGSREDYNWRGSKNKFDFFDLKEMLLSLIGDCSQISFIPCNNYPLLHNGRCAKILSLNKEVGVIGQLHPKFVKDLDLEDMPYVFEIDLNVILNSLAKFSLAKVNKMPKVERDLVFVVNENILAIDIINIVQKNNITNLVELSMFDIYQGENIKPGFKSMGLKFKFQGLKTLTDEEVESSLKSIIALLKQQFKIELRG